MFRLSCLCTYTLLLEQRISRCNECDTGKQKVRSTTYLKPTPERLYISGTRPSWSHRYEYRPRKGGFISLAPIRDKTLIKCFEDKTSLKNVSRYHAWLKSEERIYYDYGRRRRFRPNRKSCRTNR